MLFAELEKQESMAQRIIFYPKRWDEERAGRKTPDRTLETSMRLLRTAVSRYKVMLQPIEAAMGAKDCRPPSQSASSRDALTRDVANIEGMYPLIGLMSLTTFNRLIYLRPSGLIVDSSQLDLLFTLPVDTATLGISATDNEEDAPVSIVIFQPSIRAYDELSGSFPAEGYTDIKLMQAMPAMTDFAKDQVHLVTTTGALKSTEESLSPQDYLENTGYIHLVDAEFPGPEYFMSSSMLSTARPRRAGPQQAWERTYELFRERRIDVCGLDLEPIEPDPTSTQANGG